MTLNFSFRGTEHQATLIAALAIMALGFGLIATGYVHWGWFFVAWFFQVVFFVISSVGFHRLFCHQSYKTNKVTEYILLYLCSVVGYGSSIHFVLSHIWHHRYSDTDKDPQQFKYFTDIFKAKYVEYKASFKDKRMVYRRVGRFPEHRFMHTWYWLVCAATVFLFLGVGYATGYEWKLLMYVYLLPAAAAIFAGRAFNWLAHDGMRGPRNLLIWGILLGPSEHLHENHHDSPGSWDYREKPTDIDFGAYFIWCVMKNRPSFMDFITVRHKLGKRQLHADY